jgi:hypothetical protein
MLFYFMFPSMFINHVLLFICNSVTSFVFGSNIFFLLLYVPMGLYLCRLAGAH